MTSSLCASAIALYCDCLCLPVACCVSPPLLWLAQQLVPALDCAHRHTFRSSAAVWLRSQVPAEAREVFPSAQLDLSNGQRMVQFAVVLQDPRGQVLVFIINPKPYPVPCLGIYLLPQARPHAETQNAPSSCLLGLTMKTISSVPASS